MFDSIKIRSAMMHHQKGDLQRAKQEYETFFQKGCYEKSLKYYRTL